MDPITHGIIGGMIVMGTGKATGINDPVFLAASLGAMAPDLDIIYHIKGQLSYLENHRGKSHGLLGLIVWSSVTTLILSWFYGLNWIYWLWAFIGGISHTALDALNSYGINFYSRGKKQKISLNLLQVFDPVVFILGLLGLVSVDVGLVRFAIINIGLWIGIRYLCKRLGEMKISNWLTEVYGSAPSRLLVMPAMWGIWRWDFVAEYQDSYLSGSWWMDRKQMIIAKEIPRIDSETRKKALQTKVGKFFTSLTPVYAITREEWQNREALVFYDLRYLVGDRFLHRATIILDNKGQPYLQVLQPFREDNCINI